MINKLRLFIIIFLVSAPFIKSYSSELDINAKSIEIDKSNQIISAKGNVEVLDDKQNLILSNQVKYDKLKGELTTFGDTSITTSENFKIKSKNIFYDKNKKIISSDENTEITDKDGNKIFVNMFNYIVDKNMFLSKGEIKIIDIRKNEYYFSEIYIDEKKKKIAGSDVRTFLNDNSFKYDKRNEPRFFANSAEISEEKTTFSKGIFTTCEVRENDKCPPWVIRAKEIKHDSAKKTIYYDSAVLKIYDFPIFYFPKFFHPDPTVKRQSGFLLPEISNSSNLGFASSVPYFWSISNDKDMTITPKFYNSENLLIQNEYRQAFKNSFLITDSSYTKGYKNTNKKEKSSGSRNHFFANFIYNFFEEENTYSNLEVDLQHVSNDDYLKNYDLNTELADRDQTIIRNELRFQRQSRDDYVGLIASSFENTEIKNRSKYEYILPNLIYEKNLVSNNKIGIVDLYTNAIGKNFNVNQTTKFLINNLGWKSKSFNNAAGIQSNFEGLLKVVTYDAENTDNFKNEDFNFETFGALSYNASLPMFKKNLEENEINFFTPKISFRHSPGHMRNISDDELRLDYTNLFSINKNSQIDVVENGSSVALGLELSNKDLQNRKIGAENYSLSIGQIYNFDDNFDMPSRSSLDQKISDLVGVASVKFSDNFSVKNEFSLDHNFNEINYNDFKAKLVFGKTNFNIGFLEENNHVGNNSYVKSDINLELNDSNNLSFNLKRNLETDSTEFYNLAYNYINDCLKAGLVYRREYYTDRDIEETETVMFNIALFPFGNVALPTLDR